MKIELDMYQTLALAVLVLMLGKFLRERVRLLDKFCIPAPVIGGVLFAIFTCICYQKLCGAYRRSSHNPDDWLWRVFALPYRK